MSVSSIQVGEPLIPGATQVVFALNSRPFTINSLIKAVWIQSMREIQNFCCFFSESTTMNLVMSPQESEDSDLIKRLFKNPAVRIIFPSATTPEILCKQTPKWMRTSQLLGHCLTFSFSEEEDWQAFLFAQAFLFPKGYCINHRILEEENRMFYVYAIPKIICGKEKVGSRLLEMRKDLENLQKRFISFHFLQNTYLPFFKDRGCPQTKERPLQDAEDEQKIPRWPAVPSQQMSQEGVYLPSISDGHIPKQDSPQSKSIKLSQRRKSAIELEPQPPPPSPASQDKVSIRAASSPRLLMKRGIRLPPIQDFQPGLAQSDPGLDPLKSPEGQS